MVADNCRLSCQLDTLVLLTNRSAKLIRKCCKSGNYGYHFSLLVTVMTTRKTYIIFVTGLLLFTSCIGQTEDNKQFENSNNTHMENYELTPQTAHPKAKKLLIEEFYWSPIEESGPFGNDDGSDAFYGFREWRQSNTAISPIVYLRELIESWGYSSFDLNELNEENLKKYVSSSPLGAEMLTGQDNAIIAVGFGQFVLEGKIDEDIKTLTKTAIKRELFPSIIGMWDEEYKQIRTEQLTKMLASVDKMNE